MAGLSLIAALLTALLAQSAAATTPLPPKAEGSGSEPTAGAAVMPGTPFTAHYAIAQLDISFDQIEIFLFAKQVACNEVAFAPPPYLEVTLDTHGKPMIVGHPSLANGIADGHVFAFNRQLRRAGAGGTKRPRKEGGVDPRSTPPLRPDVPDAIIARIATWGNGSQRARFRNPLERRLSC